MTRRNCRFARTPGWIAATLLSLAHLAAPAPRAAAQVVAGERAEADRASDDGVSAAHSESSSTIASLVHVVRTFDFNERDKGNFEEVPAHWTRLRGPGLPSFSRGEFDDAGGAAAPPSFRLNVQTGNVAYEYQNNDLAVVPHSDYSVAARVRAPQLRHARAFVSAYFLNRFGERIPGSQRVSNVIGGSGSTEWQRAELHIPGEFPDAFRMRIQVWILQNEAWMERDPHRIDPIAREDVNVSAWFDDLTIQRLPRARLRLSTPSGVVAPSRGESVELELSHAITPAIHARLDILNTAGRTVFTGEHVGGSSAAAPRSPSAAEDSGHAAASRHAGISPPRPTHARRLFTFEIPPLPAGVYEAAVTLLVSGEPLLERRLRFAAVTKLPVVPAFAPDLGVDLGPWQGGTHEGLAGLLRELGCASVKIGVELLNSMDDRAAAGELFEIANVTRELAKERVDAVAVLCPPASSGPEVNLSDLVRRDQGWRQQLSPTLVHFSGLLTSWQLGDERAELAGDGWDAASVDTVRSQLRRFISIPELVVPQSGVETGWSGPFARSVWVPLEVPTRDLIRHFRNIDPEAWLRLELPPAGGMSPERRWAEIARRIILAKALNVRKVFVDAPFHARLADRRSVWEPNQDFAVLRTLFHHLSGKRPVAAMATGETMAVLFRQGRDDSCLAIWSWRDDGVQQRDLYLGASPVAVDLLGAPVPLRRSGGRTVLPVGPSPILVSGLHTEEALIEASFELTPTQIQVHDPDPKPVVRFRNPYDVTLSGEVWLTPPKDWQVQPRRIPFALPPGQTLEQALSFELPPQQVAVTDDLDVQVRIRQPERTEMEFVRSISIGLREIAVEVHTRWDGDALVVEHTLRNMSNDALRFASYCEAPGRPRTEGLFLDVAKGEIALQTYVFPKARGMIGATLHLGIEEIRGQRRLNQLVEVKP